MGVIKLEELRLGNLVGYCNLFYKVDGISRFGYSSSLGESERVSIIRIDGLYPCSVEDTLELLDPIELTKDILDKCKLEPGLFKGTYRVLPGDLFKTPISIDIVDGDKKVLLSIGEEADILRIQWFHQLQNIYYMLTGKELEYEFEIKIKNE